MHNVHLLFLPPVFLDHLDLQVVKIYGFYKIVLREPGFAAQLKIPDVHVEPDRFSQIKFMADLSDGVDDLGRPGVRRIVSDRDVPHHPVLLKCFCPKCKH